MTREVVSLEIDGEPTVLMPGDAIIELPDARAQDLVRLFFLRGDRYLAVTGGHGVDLLGPGRAHEGAPDATCLVVHRRALKHFYRMLNRSSGPAALPHAPPRERSFSGSTQSLW